MLKDRKKKINGNNKTFGQQKWFCQKMGKKKENCDVR